MTTITFDTLEFVTEMQEAGMPEKQAKAEAKILKKTLEANNRELATKTDLSILREEMKSDMRAMEARLDGELKLNRWMLTIVVAATVLPLLKGLFT